MGCLVWRGIFYKVIYNRGFAELLNSEGEHFVNLFCRRFRGIYNAAFFFISNFSNGFLKTTRIQYLINIRIYIAMRNIALE